MSDQTLRIGSLCSGAGGLDMAVEQVFGARTAWHCELPTLIEKKGNKTRERHNSAVDVLAHRWPGVPNHGDLIATDWLAVEPIDIMCAGWPCQPFSPAGRRKGADDERAIWPDIARAIRVVRPRIIVLENVTDVLTRGEFTRVANSLAPLGYDLRWTCLRASDVGAPHPRDRLFILAADTTRDGWELVDTALQLHSLRQASALPEAAGGAEAMRVPSVSESDSSFSRGDAVATYLGAIVSLLPTPCASDGAPGGAADPGARIAQGHHVQMIDVGTRPDLFGKYEPAIRRWEALTRPAPPPSEPNSKGKPRLNPAFPEWMMGWPAGWVTAVPGISRNDQLRIIGAGVVPQQAAAAVRSLLAVSKAQR
ncbi:MAG: DNA cytosine methyltransferase [Mycobacterium kyogaense]|uniref:DNA cytosine methyltransferase n=1 Tax=Mycobacterium kyogaense TaxID=2212479 RepID=UPI002FF6C8FF